MDETTEAKPIPHGTTYGYNHHRCTCQPCRNAWRVYNAALRADRAVRLAADPSLAEHGSRSTYVNWMCRCDDCTLANRTKR